MTGIRRFVKNYTCQTLKKKKSGYVAQQIELEILRIYDTYVVLIDKEIDVRSEPIVSVIAVLEPIGVRNVDH
jgi:hypothetical protein